MSGFLRAAPLRALAGLTLVLLLVAPAVIGTGHDDHEGERCPICKLSQTLVLGVKQPAHGPLAVSRPFASLSVASPEAQDVFLPFTPRGPPA